MTKLFYNIGRATNFVSAISDAPFIIPFTVRYSISTHGNIHKRENQDVGKAVALTILLTALAAIAIIPMNILEQWFPYVDETKIYTKCASILGILIVLSLVTPAFFRGKFIGEAGTVISRHRWFYGLFIAWEDDTRRISDDHMLQIINASISGDAPMVKKLLRSRPGSTNTPK